MAPPLSGLFVVDLSEGIAGAYCTKLLADGGAEVVKLEVPAGDPLRSRSAGPSVDCDVGGPLFQFLACSKRSVAVDAERSTDIALALSLVQAADIVVCSRASGLDTVAELRAPALHAAAPAAVVAAVSPYGLTGPWADRPAAELVLQAWAGAIAGRGMPSLPPAYVGGEPGQWLAGLFAAVGALTARRRTARTGVGELIDVSTLESLVLCSGMYQVTQRTMMTPDAAAKLERGPRRQLNIPAIEKTSDGWVGFMVATAAMWEAFCVAIGHAEWLEDPSLYAYVGRAARRDELETEIRAWVGAHTTDEVVQQCALLRVPAAPIGEGPSIPHFEQFAERNWYIPNPRSGFLQPDVPYTLGGSAERRAPEPSPRLGEHGDAERAAPRSAKPVVVSKPDAPLPFAGLRVADFTAFWAGPIVGHYLATLGADVVHVESPNHPDLIRLHSVKTPDNDGWWEWGPLFHGANTNKRDLTLDLATERGRELAIALVERCDIVLENYSPRVVEQWGLGYESVRAARPDAVFVRMPAFGLDGPWRERTGYAQTLEQVSGIAWRTGFPEGPPYMANGMCDPLAGMHAVYALLLALAHRDRTGEGMLVECPMVGAALNIAAELVVEHQAHGVALHREGNHGRGVPHNLYLSSERDVVGRQDLWVAVVVDTDEQWHGLRRALGEPSWAADPALGDLDGRRAAEAVIDKQLGEWCAERTRHEIVAALDAERVPCAEVIFGRHVDDLDQLMARSFYEDVTHPVTGMQLHMGYPVRFGNGPSRWHRSPAPTFGQHNRSVLQDLLGLSVAEVDQLEHDGIVGTRVHGAYHTK